MAYAVYFIVYDREGHHANQRANMETVKLSENGTSPVKRKSECEY